MYTSKRKIIPINEKIKDMIILKGIIKRNDTMEMKYDKGVDCIY